MLGLKAEGSAGFEGLLAKILSVHIQQAVRLSKSGYQFGQDGSSSLSDTFISFEAKRYGEKFNDKTLLQKIPQLMHQPTPPDLWIAGISTEVNASLINTVRSVSEQTGIGCIIVDWPHNSLAPPLIAFCLLAPDAAEEFLIENAPPASNAPSISESFKSLREYEELKTASDALSKELTDASIGLSLATQMNRSWLEDRLASSTKARASFGQRLCPKAEMSLPLQKRVNLTTAIKERIFTSEPSAPVFIVGKQGFGKSWAFMTAWSEAELPLMVITLTANKAAKLASVTDIIDPLVMEFITQTGGVFPELAAPRWRRRFSRWSQATKPKRPRYVLFLDGLNQRADANWVEILDALYEFTESTGGQIAITIRSALFNRLKNRVPRHDKTINVSHWSNQELGTILAGSSVDIDDLSTNVIEILRVPRLCALAFELLGANRINDFTQLTVGGLLYAQIASGEANHLEPNDFAKEIEVHARETLERIRKQHPDPTLFEPNDSDRIAIHKRLELLCQDGYFEADPVSPSDYDILPTTLSLGLAISLVRQLRRAAKSTTSLQVLCTDLLEPIEAVDQTAEIVLDALLIAAADEYCSDAVIATIFHAFVELQNVAANYYSAFCFAASLRPGALLEAFEEIKNGAAAAKNEDWFLGAAAYLASEPNTQESIAAALERWLRQYSLTPELGAAPKGNTLTDVEVTKQADKVKERIADLSPYESGLLNDMTISPDGPIYGLIDAALILLREFKLTRFVPALTRYVFAQNINSPWHHSLSNFTTLVQFNRRDWENTRKAIIGQVNAIADSRPSRAGKWTMAQLLQATGHPEDADRAHLLHRELEDQQTKAIRTKFSSRKEWHPQEPTECVDSDRLEFCADRLSKINLSQWRIDRGNAIENQVIKDDLPYLARFALVEAVAFQRSLTDEMLTRHELPLNMAVFSLTNESVLFDTDRKIEMVEKALALSVDWDSKTGDGGWVTQQYLMLMGLADRSGQDQIDAISRLPDQAALMTQFDDIIEKASPDSVQSKLKQAIARGAPNQIVSMLLFANALGKDLTSAVIEICEDLLGHESSMVRAYAMRALIRSKNAEAIMGFAKSLWSADGLPERENAYERWFGGQLLIEAAAQKFITVRDLIPRITPSHFPWAISRFGDEIAPLITNVLTVAFERQFQDREEDPPIITATLAAPGSLEPEPVSLSDREQSPTDPVEAFAQLAKIDEQFQQRQQNRSKAYGRFLSDMTEQQGEDLLGDMGFESVKACAAFDLEVVRGWAENILSSTGWKRRVLKPVGLHIARALCIHAPDLSVSLYKLLLKTDGFVRFQTGAAKIDHEAIAVWAGATLPDIRDLCFKRLDACADDESLYREVLAALHAQKIGLLTDYAHTKIATEHPMNTCRGLLVAGIADINIEDTDCFLKARGPIGAAARTANAFRKRYVAMQHWWNELHTAETPDHFWQASVLLRECVDGRFDFLSPASSPGSLPDYFLSFLEQEFRRGIERAGREHEKTLFGGRKPKPWFLSG